MLLKKDGTKVAIEKMVNNADVGKLISMEKAQSELVDQLVNNRNFQTEVQSILKIVQRKLILKSWPLKIKLC